MLPAPAATVAVPFTVAWHRVTGTITAAGRIGVRLDDGTEAGIHREDTQASAGTVTVTQPGKDYLIYATTRKAARAVQVTEGPITWPDGP